MIPRLSLALLNTRDAVHERYRGVLAPHRLTMQQWRVLSTLARTGERDATRLATQTGIQPPSLTRILQGMETRGVVTVRRDPDDGRRTLLSLSDPGKTLVEELSPRIATVEESILRAFGAERCRALTIALEDLERALAGSD